MDKTLASAHQLVDIIPPATPALDSSINLLPIIIIIFITAAWLTWRWHQSANQQILRRLKQLLFALESGELESRTTVYWLASFIKQHFSINYIHADINLPDHTAPNNTHTEQQQWKHFLQKLDNARYSNHEIAKKEATQLINDARIIFKSGHNL